MVFPGVLSGLPGPLLATNPTGSTTSKPVVPWVCCASQSTPWALLDPPVGVGVEVSAVLEEQAPRESAVEVDEHEVVDPGDGTAAAARRLAGEARGRARVDGAEAEAVEMAEPRPGGRLRADARSRGHLHAAQPPVLGDE